MSNEAEQNHVIEGDVVEEKECVLCGRALAGLGVAIGLVFLYMSIDVLTNGRLTQILGLGGRMTAEEGIE